MSLVGKVNELDVIESRDSNDAPREYFLRAM
jgi:hypothetical protein